jgi:tetratricopeptide (TPR) repeat protein
MLLDAETIAAQQTLLATHRQRLAVLFQQVARFGLYVPPYMVLDIQETQQTIRAIKVPLAAAGIPIDIDPNDDFTPLIASPFTTQALHQLRAPVPDYVGREPVVAQVVKLLRRAASAGGGSAICLIRGMGGLGKTELAYQAAHQLLDAFPDAQLVVEMRGASSAPLTPRQVLRTVIGAFAPATKLPRELAHIQSLYRSLLSGKHVLVLADDAQDESQIRVLLPPAGSALLVTSRNHISIPGMVVIDLAGLAPGEAETLLLSIYPRIGEHAPELAALCGYLPLALRVSAGYLNEEQPADIGGYLRQLRADRLTHLSHSNDPYDPQASVAASLKLSYHALDPLAQTALCRLSVFPGSGEPAAALAVVTAPPIADAEPVLRTLRRRSLLEWDASGGRYRLHDLVHAFAERHLSTSERERTRLRHADYYRALAEMLEPGLQSADEVAHLRQLELEWPNLQAALEAAFELGAVEIGSRLSSSLLWFWTMHHHLKAGDRWLSKAVATSEQLPLAVRAKVHYAAGLVALFDGAPARGLTHLEASLSLYEALGNTQGRAWALRGLGSVARAQADYPRARTHYMASLALHTALGDEQGMTWLNNNLGTIAIAEGKYDEAQTWLDTSLGISRKRGETWAIAYASHHLGRAATQQGCYREAQQYYAESLPLFQQLGNRMWEADNLADLAEVQLAMGEISEAISSLERALELIQDLGEQVRFDEWTTRLAQARAAE